MRAAARPPTERGGIFLGLLALLAAVAALAALAWMLLLPVVATAHLRARTGFDAQVRSLMVNPFTGRVVAHGVVLANPPAFPRRDFLQLRDVEVEAELRTLFTDRPVLRRLRLDASLVALVKRADGRTNFQALPEALAGGPAPAGPGRPRAWLIRRLELKIDRLVISDHRGGSPVEREHALQLDRRYENVSGVGQLELPAELAEAVERAVRAGPEARREMSRKSAGIVRRGTGALEESKKP